MKQEIFIEGKRSRAGLVRTRTGRRLSTSHADEPAHTESDQCGWRAAQTHPLAHGVPSAPPPGTVPQLHTPCPLPRVEEKERWFCKAASLAALCNQVTRSNGSLSLRCQLGQFETLRPANFFNSFLACGGKRLPQVRSQLWPAHDHRKTGGRSSKETQDPHAQRIPPSAISVFPRS
jgi:hypothetical protein